MVKDFSKINGLFTQYADLIEKNTEQAVRRSALAALSSAVMTTPVDTGRARNNWFSSLTIPDDTSTIPDSENNNNGASGTEAVIARNKPVIDNFKTAHRSIFLTNNLPYILRLENGSSTQRPEGMTQHAIASAVSVLSKSSIIIKR